MYGQIKNNVHQILSAILNYVYFWVSSKIYVQIVFFPILNYHLQWFCKKKHLKSHSIFSLKMQMKQTIRFWPVITADTDVRHNGCLVGGAWKIISVLWATWVPWPNLDNGSNVYKKKLSFRFSFFNFKSKRLFLYFLWKK